MSIVISAPTGQIGSRVVGQLLEAGHPVTVIARDPAKLSAAVRAKATIVAGSLDEPGVLDRATVGAESLFLLIPPNFGTDDPSGFQLGIAKLAADAIARNGVKRVVFLSSLGAHRDDMAAVSRLGQTEKLLDAVAPNVVSVRAAFFLENLFSAVPTIADHGAIYFAFTPDQRGPVIATRDIADVIVEELLDASWSGHRVRELHGAADRSFAEVAAAVSNAIGKPVHYVSVDRAAVKGALLGGGATEAIADDYAVLYTKLAEHFDDHAPRTAETTTPTTVEQFVEEVLAPALAKASGALASR